MKLGHTVAKDNTGPTFEGMLVGLLVGLSVGLLVGLQENVPFFFTFM